MKKKSGFLIEEHEKWGKELSRMAERFTNLSVCIGNAYPQKLFRKAAKVKKELSLLRSALDNCLFKENPDFTGKYLYYPKLTAKEK